MRSGQDDLPGNAGWGEREGGEWTKPKVMRTSKQPEIPFEGMAEPQMEVGTINWRSLVGCLMRHDGVRLQMMQIKRPV